MIKILLHLMFMSIFFILNCTAINNAPIIGILTHEIMNDAFNSVLPETYSGSYMPASYVKFIEGGGGRVVPIYLGRTKEYYESIMSQINGVLFIGGNAPFNVKNGYFEAGKYIYDIAVKMNEQNDYMPIFGTCLGFELLGCLSSDIQDPLVNCSSQNQLLPLTFTSEYKSSTLFGQAPSQVIDILKNDPVTVNSHGFCITRDSLNRSGIENKWTVLSENNDINGLTFVSSFEHTMYPFYGIQFHPEKNIYEWDPKQEMYHTYKEIVASQFFAQFFVNQTKHSAHKFNTIEEERDNLIYNFVTTYTDSLLHSKFQQIYLFENMVQLS